jgi:hypothetical protein
MYPQYYSARFFAEKYEGAFEAVLALLTRALRRGSSELQSPLVQQPAAVACPIKAGQSTPSAGPQGLGMLSSLTTRIDLGPTLATPTLMPFLADVSTILLGAIYRRKIRGCRCTVSGEISMPTLMPFLADVSAILLGALYRRKIRSNI